MHLIRMFSSHFALAFILIFLPSQASGQSPPDGSTGDPPGKHQNELLAQKDNLDAGKTSTREPKSIRADETESQNKKGSAIAPERIYKDDGSTGDPPEKRRATSSRKNGSTGDPP